MTELLETRLCQQYPASLALKAPASPPRQPGPGASPPSRAVRGGPAGAGPRSPPWSVAALPLRRFHSTSASRPGSASATVAEAVDGRLRVLQEVRGRWSVRSGIHQVKPCVRGRASISRRRSSSPATPTSPCAEAPSVTSSTAARRWSCTSGGSTSSRSSCSRQTASPGPAAADPDDDRRPFRLKPRLQRAAVARRRPRVRAGLGHRRDGAATARSEARRRLTAPPQ